MKLGIIGGGQLARMLAIAAKKINVSTIVLDPDPQSSASQITQHIIGDLNDPCSIKKLALESDVLTYELEHIDAHLIKKNINDVSIFPSLKALEISQDRLYEKNYLNNIGLQTTQYHEISNNLDIEKLSNINQDYYLKIRRSGFDGRGQVKINDTQTLKSAFDYFNFSPCILEETIPFEYECSIITARDKSGKFLFYPLVKNTHDLGILKYSEIHSDTHPLQAQAESIAEKLMSSLNYIGVMTIEFFYMQGQLIINEIAPRVHNSGHWSIEGTNCSQFESHIRCLFDLTLPPLSTINNTCMYNILGRYPDTNVLASKANIFIHSYNKGERAQRKLGHITILNPTIEDKTAVVTLLSG